MPLLSHPIGQTPPPLPNSDRVLKSASFFYFIPKQTAFRPTLNKEGFKEGYRIKIQRGSDLDLFIQGHYCTASLTPTKCIPPESWQNKNSWWDIISRLRLLRFYPGRARWQREWECLHYGFYWYVILATWWKHHSFFGNFKEGKNGSEKCTLIHSLIYLCIDLIYLSRAQKYHILLLISWTTFISRRTKSYAVLKYKCTQTSLSFWTCRHQSEIFVWHEVFYIKITHALWDGDPVTRAISWN